MLNSFHSCPAFVALILTAFGSTSQLRAGDVTYFPDSTDIAIVVNLNQVLHCEAIKSQPGALGELKEALEKFAGIAVVQKYLQVAGLDAFRDLQRITYVYTDTKNPTLSFLVLEGTFSVEKLNGVGKADGGEFHITQSGADTVYEIAPRGAKRLYATAIGPSKVIVSDTEEELAKARARVNGAKKSSLNPKVRKWLETIDDNQSVAFVTTGPAFARLVEGASVAHAENAIALLKTLDSFSGDLTLAQGIQFQLVFNAESEAIAKKLTDSANGGLRILLTFVQQNAEKDTRFSSVINVVKGLGFTQAGTGIRFRGDVSLETVEKLMADFPPLPGPKDRK